MGTAQEEVCQGLSRTHPKPTQVLPAQPDVHNQMLGLQGSVALPGPERLHRNTCPASCPQPMSAVLSLYLLPSPHPWCLCKWSIGSYAIMYQVWLPPDRGCMVCLPEMPDSVADASV